MSGRTRACWRWVDAGSAPTTRGGRACGQYRGRKLLNDVVSYLCLVAHTVAAINPDVFGENLALLVKFHVFGQLLTVSVIARKVKGEGRVTHIGTVGNDGGSGHLDVSSVMDLLW